jgi:hypothetical protein
MPDPITNSTTPACVLQTEHGPIACNVPPDAPEWTQVDVPLSELATRCLSELDAIALGAASRNPLIAALAGLKAGIDLGYCIEEAQREENLSSFVREAERTCREHGGAPVGVRGDQFICITPEDSR